MFFKKIGEKLRFRASKLVKINFMRQNFVNFFMQRQKVVIWPTVRACCCLLTYFKPFFLHPCYSTFICCS